jgi:hypothetical protein
MSEKKIYTPILFLIFNRPDTTKQVFDEIRQAQPAQLFIAADGPRKDQPHDYELCKITREIIHQVDWDCKVYTRFQDENLGCKRGVSSAIDWFFSNVEEGIILEDDCVPDQSFFPFCQELLERYRDDKRIMMISGMNYIFNKMEMKESYFFSRYYPIWGWATWKRAWSYYDLNMADWPEYNPQIFLNHLYCHTKIAGFLHHMFKEAYFNKIDTWDIQWAFACLINNGLAICPKFNLISNIGVTGSHANNVSRFHYMPVRALNVSNIYHPRHVIPNFDLDNLSFNEITKSESIYIKFCRFITLQND